MNGNTWRRYRFATEGTQRAPFFLEPTNPRQYPEYFIDAGFTVLAAYHSTIFDLATKPDDRTPQAVRRFADDGIAIRPLDLARLDDDLSAIHSLSLESFADNFLYSPLPRAAFAEQYRRLGPLLRPEFALLAQRGPELLAFVFALPDALERAGAATRTLIVKTVAVRAERRASGLGSVLIDLVRRRAADLGFTRAIHALIHDDNVSRHIGAGQAELLRRYALYARELR
jgi:L-amino acid N-acyltransferase YncA